MLLPLAAQVDVSPDPSCCGVPTSKLSERSEGSVPELNIYKCSAKTHRIAKFCSVYIFYHCITVDRLAWWVQQELYSIHMQNMDENHELRDLEVPSPAHDLEHLLRDSHEESPPIADNGSASSAIAPPNKAPTPRVQLPSRRQHLHSRWHSIAWKVEISSWIVSASCFIALVITLKVFDGHPLPQLKFGITPSAIIQILSTLGEFFLEISYGSGIGQLKWLNALQRTPLADFHTIDEASRGAWGSVVLIVSRRGG